MRAGETDCFLAGMNRPTRGRGCVISARCTSVVAHRGVATKFCGGWFGGVGVGLVWVGWGGGGGGVGGGGGGVLPKSRR